MDNYYKRPSPQELRYRDVLRAISELGPTAKELADELDESVRQLVNRAIDVAITEQDLRAGELLLDRLNRASEASRADQVAKTH
jgi:hypothetical protein